MAKTVFYSIEVMECLRASQLLVCPKVILFDEARNVFRRDLRPMITGSTKVTLRARSGGNSTSMAFPTSQMVLSYSCWCVARSSSIALEMASQEQLVVVALGSLAGSFPTDITSALVSVIVVGTFCNFCQSLVSNTYIRSGGSQCLHSPWW